MAEETSELPAVVAERLPLTDLISSSGNAAADKNKKIALHVNNAWILTATHDERKPSFRPQRADEDAGWAWVVLFSSFMISVIVWGQVISFNIYFVILRDVFHESRSTIAWIGSVNQASVNLFAILSGFYLAKLGIHGTTTVGGLIASLGFIASYFANSARHLFFTYSILVGLGFSMCFSASLAAVGNYFRRHLFVATSISVTGGGLGIIFFASLLEYLCAAYSWRGSMLIQGAITLNICACGSTVFPRPKQPPVENGKLPQGPPTDSRPASNDAGSVRMVTVSQHLQDFRVLTLMVIGLLGGAGLLGSLVVYKDLAISKGMDSFFDESMAFVGGGNIVGRLSAGPIMRYTQPILYFVGVMLTCNVTLFLLMVTRHSTAFLVLSGFLGYTQGNFVSAVPNIVAHIYGRHNMAVTYGYVLFSSGIGLMLGGPMAGVIADVTNSYSMYLMVCGCLMSTVTLLVILLYFYQKIKVNEK